MSVKILVVSLLAYGLVACGGAPDRFKAGTPYSSKNPKDDDLGKDTTKGEGNDKGKDKGEKPDSDDIKTDKGEDEIKPDGEKPEGWDTPESEKPETMKPDPVVPDPMKPVDPVVPTPMPVNCQTFSWESIKKPEDALCFKSVLEAFQSLPETVKPFFILMRDSRSAQASTLDKPRVIITAPDGSFLMGAATDPNARKDLELAVFDYEKAEWQFAGIDFSTTPPKVEKELCKTCHGAEPHPIWTRYGGWTGAFAANNFLKEDEVEVIKKAISGSADSPDILKTLKYRSASSYAAGRRLEPSVRYFNGEENSQILNYTSMQKAAQITVGKMLRDPLISTNDLIAMSAEISCGTRSGTMQKFGYSIEKNLRFGLEGIDRQGDMFNGRFNASVYLAAELVGRAFAKDPTLKDKLPDAARVFADKRYGYFTTKNIKEHADFTANVKVSIRNVMSDYLNSTVYTALKSSSHCSAVKTLTGQ